MIHGFNNFILTSFCLLSMKHDKQVYDFWPFIRDINPFLFYFFFCLVGKKDMSYSLKSLWYKLMKWNVLITNISSNGMNLDNKNHKVIFWFVIEGNSQNEEGTVSSVLSDLQQMSTNEGTSLNYSIIVRNYFKRKTYIWLDKHEILCVAVFSYYIFIYCYIIRFKKIQTVRNKLIQRQLNLFNCIFQTLYYSGGLRKRWYVNKYDKKRMFAKYSF